MFTLSEMMHAMRPFSPRTSIANSKPLVARVKPTGREYIVPRSIALVVRGTKPRKITKFLLNKRTVHKFDQLLEDMTKSSKPDWGLITRVYALNGMPILNLQEFFKTCRIFFVSPKPMQKAEFSLHAHEMKVLEDQLKAMGGVPEPYKATNTSTGMRGRSEGNFRIRNFNSDESEVETNADPKRVCTRRSRSRVKIYSRKKMKQINWAYDFTSYKPLYYIGPVFYYDNLSITRRCQQRESYTKFWLKATDVNKLDRMIWGESSVYLSEIEFLKTIRHPHIVSVMDWGDECILKPYIYVTFEYNQEGNLEELIADGHVFNEPHAAFIVKDVSSALEHIHSINIVHRNIRLENLWVYPSGDFKYHVKLAAFEFALRKTDGVPLMGIFGEAAYIAPEMMERTGYGPEVDVWMLGIVLFEIIHGGLPFDLRVSDRFNPEELNINSDKWGSLSADCRATILHMLTVKPEYRATAEDLLVCDWIEKNTINAPEYDENGVYRLFGQDETSHPWKPFRAMGQSGQFEA